MDDQGALKKIGILGWHGRGNAGDELLRCAISQLITQCHASPVPITGHMSEESLREIDGLVIGGGSLVDGPIDELSGLNASEKPVAYFSVGLETDVHSDHCEMLKRARFVLHRSPIKKGEFTRSCVGATGNGAEWITVPDAVYTLPCSSSRRDDRWRDSRDVLFLPNCETVPTWRSPHWAHASWDRFKDETAQFLDVLVEGGWRPRFMGSCLNPVMDDGWASAEITARMCSRSPAFVSAETLAIEPMIATHEISQYRAVITQRYHGVILSRMAGVPCLAIHHHDKIKDAYPAPEASIAYHGVTKDSLLREFNSAINSLAYVGNVPYVGEYNRCMESFVRSLKGPHQ